MWHEKCKTPTVFLIQCFACIWHECISGFQTSHTFRSSMNVLQMSHWPSTGWMAHGFSIIKVLDRCGVHYNSEWIKALKLHFLYHIYIHSVMFHVQNPFMRSWIYVQKAMWETQEKTTKSFVVSTQLLWCQNINWQETLCAKCCISVN